MSFHGTVLILEGEMASTQCSKKEVEVYLKRNPIRLLGGLLSPKFLALCGREREKKNIDCLHEGLLTRVLASSKLDACKSFLSSVVMEASRNLPTM